MNKKDGDFPAFPCREKVITGYTADVPVSWNSKGTVDGRPVYEEIQHGGMTLRDYFAAAALTGLSSATNKDGTWQADIPETAETAYFLADAMLAEREK